VNTSPQTAVADWEKCLGGESLLENRGALWVPTSQRSTWNWHRNFVEKEFQLKIEQIVSFGERRRFK